jgi:hypothetical protein
MDAAGLVQEGLLAEPVNVSCFLSGLSGSRRVRQTFFGWRVSL